MIASTPTPAKTYVDPKRFADGSLVRVLLWQEAPDDIRDGLKWSLFRDGMGEPDYLILTPCGADPYSACVVVDALTCDAVFHTHEKFVFDGTKCSVKVAGRSR